MTLEKTLSRFYSDILSKMQIKLDIHVLWNAGLFSFFVKISEMAQFLQKAKIFLMEPCKIDSCGRRGLKREHLYVFK